MREWDANTKIFYLTDEERGILCSGLRELQNSPYINESTFMNADKLICYLCEEIEPEE